MQLPCFTHSPVLNHSNCSAINTTGLQLTEIIVFCVYWIALVTVRNTQQSRLCSASFSSQWLIVFLPKIVTLFKESEGMVPEIETNSRSGNSTSENSTLRGRARNC